MLATLSCSDATAPDGLNADDLAADANRTIGSIVVTFADSTIVAGDSTQATANVYDRRGRPLSRTVTWSSSSTSIATVSSSGWVKGVAQGQAVIAASHNGHSGSAPINVTAAGGTDVTPVASVSVTLASSTLSVGQTTQGTATTRDSAGNVLTGRAIKWGSTDSTVAIVSDSGRVTALKIGSAQISATSENKTGSAALTVRDTVAPPPPPPPPENANEPPGMTKITSREFNAVSDTPHWQDEDPAIFFDDPTAPSPTKVWRAQYPKGFAAGSGACNSWLFMPDNLHTVYLSWWFRYSTNWYGQSTGTNKQLYVWTNGDHPTMYVFARGVGMGELLPYATVQGSKVPRSDELLLGPNLVPSARIVRGKWQHLELVLVGNTPGTANGSLDLYLDGVHVSSYKNMQFIDGDALWGDMNMDPVWGGLGGTVPETQTFDVDHFYASGKN
jgi:hypothetical protein